MLSELRIVTIKDGQMDNWLDLFRDRVAPLASRLDIQISGAWTDVERRRFIQIRSFEDADNMAASRARFIDHREWRAIERRVLDLAPEQDIVQLQPIWHFDDWNNNWHLQNMEHSPLAQLRMYTIKEGMLADWEDLFKRYEIPGHQAAGIPIEWLSHDLEEERFFWIRSFENEWEMEASQNRFHEGLDWQAIKDRVPTMLAHTEVMMMNPVEFE
ncbi:MAG: NIPSNAP family protein [Dehalococcoidia bacterium]